ncbi:MAG TPA: hypothetical protein VF444_12040 [Pseudonocardiaceae bacterium]
MDIETIGNLVRAEFRKVLSTKLWWALLIPTAALTFLYALIWSALGVGVVESLTDSPVYEQAGVDLQDTAISVFGLARAINIGTIFPMLLGGLALPTEIRHRTITTSYLTAPTRMSVLTAKLITYPIWGLLYGLVISLSASAGIALGSKDNTGLLPPAAGWLQIVGTGLLESVLWTLVGVGVGALLRNVVGTSITLLMYSIAVENLVALGLPWKVAGYLPNQAADGMTSSLAGEVFLHSTTLLDQVDFRNEAIQILAGARGALDWWLSGLIFLGYAAVFVVFGWLANRNRDIT